MPRRVEYRELQGRMRAQKKGLPACYRWGTPQAALAGLHRPRVSRRSRERKKRPAGVLMHAAGHHGSASSTVHKPTRQPIYLRLCSNADRFVNSRPRFRNGVLSGILASLPRDFPRDFGAYIHPTAQLRSGDAVSPNLPPSTSPSLPRQPAAYPRVHDFVNSHEICPIVHPLDHNSRVGSTSAHSPDFSANS